MDTALEQNNSVSLTKQELHVLCMIMNLSLSEYQVYLKKHPAIFTDVEWSAVHLTILHLQNLYNTENAVLLWEHIHILTFYIYQVSAITLQRISNESGLSVKELVDNMSADNPSDYRLSFAEKIVDNIEEKND